MNKAYHDGVTGCIGDHGELWSLTPPFAEAVVGLDFGFWPGGQRLLKEGNMPCERGRTGRV